MGEALCATFRHHQPVNRKQRGSCKNDGFCSKYESCGFRFMWSTRAGATGVQGGLCQQQSLPAAGPCWWTRKRWLKEWAADLRSELLQQVWETTLKLPRRPDAACYTLQENTVMAEVSDSLDTLVHEWKSIRHSEAKLHRRGSWRAVCA